MGSGWPQGFMLWLPGSRGATPQEELPTFRALLPSRVIHENTTLWVSAHSLPVLLVFPGTIPT